jgi:hypothetical protein
MRGKLMSVLSWDKPEKVLSVDEWKSNHADGAYPGTWCPNMSPEDSKKWKAKLVGNTLGFPQVEIRRDGLVVIISTKGYKYKHYNTRQTPENIAKWKEGEKLYGQSTDDYKKTVHIASSGPQSFTIDELQELKAAMDEAIEFLNNLTSAMVDS